MFLTQSARHFAPLVSVEAGVASSPSVRAEKPAIHLKRQSPTAEDNRPRGGVCFLVQKHLPHRFGETLAQDNTQAICLWVLGTAVYSLYSAPKHDEEVADLFSELYVRHNLHCHPWVCMGDFNQIPGEQSPLVTTLVNAGGHLITDFQLTRWEGAACLDWFFASTAQMERSRY